MHKEYTSNFFFFFLGGGGGGKTWHNAGSLHVILKLGTDPWYKGLPFQFVLQLALSVFATLQSLMWGLSLSVEATVQHRDQQHMLSAYDHDTSESQQVFLASGVWLCTHYMYISTGSLGSSNPIFSVCISTYWHTGNCLPTHDRYTEPHYTPFTKLGTFEWQINMAPTTAWWKDTPTLPHCSPSAAASSSAYQRGCPSLYEPVAPFAPQCMPPPVHTVKYTS